MDLITILLSANIFLSVVIIVLIYLTNRGAMKIVSSFVQTLESHRSAITGAINLSAENRKAINDLEEANNTKSPRSSASNKKN